MGIALKIGAAALSVVLPACQQLLDRRGDLQTILSNFLARLLIVLLTRSLLVDEIAVEVGRAILEAVRNLYEKLAFNDELVFNITAPNDNLQGLPGLRIIMDPSCGNPQTRRRRRKAPLYVMVEERIRHRNFILIKEAFVSEMLGAWNRLIFPRTIPTLEFVGVSPRILLLWRAAATCLWPGLGPLRL